MAVSGAPPNSHPTRAANHRRPSLAAELVRTTSSNLTSSSSLFTVPPLLFTLLPLPILTHHFSYCTSSLFSSFESTYSSPPPCVFVGVAKGKTKSPLPVFRPSSTLPPTPQVSDLELQLLPPTLISRFFPSFNRAHLNG